MTTGTDKAVDRFIRVGDLNLHYLEWGTTGNPPVIMVHGLSGNAHGFDDLAPHFVAKYHVFSVDVRGRGNSDWAEDGDYSNEAYVSDLEGFRAALGLERFSLVGTSMGGRISLSYSGTYPDRVERAVINDIGPEVDPRGGERISASTRDAITFFFNHGWRLGMAPPTTARVQSVERRAAAAYRRLRGEARFRWRLYLENGPSGPPGPSPARR